MAMAIFTASKGKGSSSSSSSKDNFSESMYGFSASNDELHELFQIIC